MDNLALTKVELIEWLTRIEDESLLEKIKDLKEKASSSSSTLKPMTSEEYRSMLNQAEEDLKNGKVTSQADLEREATKW